MILPAELTTRLIGAIETDSLVFVCGAGLSRAAPSCLLSAVDVARHCYDRWSSTETLEQHLREDLDALAEHFHNRGDFERTFLRLVPWDGLVGPPNAGHAAVADMLITSAAHSVLSSNFDGLIENWAEMRRYRLQGAITAREAAEPNRPALLKVHGCMRRDDRSTLWTHAQLTEQPIKERLEDFSSWMRLHLPGKHLVVAGFWTDWGYLNDILEGAFNVEEASSVTVIDPKDDAALAAGAPCLWKILTELTPRFQHIQASAADALDELRSAYSRSWARKFYSLGVAMAEANAVPVTVREPFEELVGDFLYDLRRDAEGVSYEKAASLKAPPDTAEQAAYLCVELLNAGARQDGAWMLHNERSIRVINGAGKDLARVREKHIEPPSLPKADYCVCAGAEDLGVPGRIVASGAGASTVRPEPGEGPQWLTLQQAREVFEL